MAVCSTGCPSDPPGDGFLLVTLAMADVSGTDLEGLESIRAEVTRVDVVHRPSCDEPSGSRVITVMREDLPPFVELTTERPDIPRMLVRLPVPPGCVDQVRFITERVSVTLSGETLVGRVPSGPQTGIKVNPADGEEPFPIVAGRTTAIRIRYDPNRALNFHPARELHHRPTLDAVRIDPELALGIVLDQVVVTFAPDATEEQIASAVSACSGAIIDRYPRNYVTIRLPSDEGLREALACYAGRDGVRAALPNMLVEAQGPNPFVGTPDDPDYALAPPDGFASLNMSVIRAPEAWAVTTGDRSVVVAVVDTGVDLLQADLLPNLWINPGEIPADVMAAFVDDGDGIVTFPELDLAVNDGLCPRDASPPVDRCDPLDLVNGNCPGGVCVAGYGWQDGVDGDGNGLVDDIIGWDFGRGDNLPEPQRILTSDEGMGIAEHGTWTASLAVGRGNNGVGGLGIAWNSRLMVVAGNALSNPPGTGIGSSVSARLLRDSVVRGIEYAYRNGARVVSLSIGTFVVRDVDEDPNACTVTVDDAASPRGVRFVPADKYDRGLQGLATEWETIVGPLQDRAVITVAMGNCRGAVSDGRLFDVDAPGRFFWPAFTVARPEHGIDFVHSTMLVVSNSIHHGIFSADMNAGQARTFPEMHPDTPIARRSAQLCAPGTGWRLPAARLFPFDGSIGTGLTECGKPAFQYCEGTSLATPIVAGAAALVFANHPTLTALEVRNRIVETASVPVVRPGGAPLLDRVEGGRLLDVAAAVGP